MTNADLGNLIREIRDDNKFFQQRSIEFNQRFLDLAASQQALLKSNGALLKSQKELVASNTVRLEEIQKDILASRSEFRETLERLFKPRGN